MARRLDWRRVKIHRSYTVDEVARLLGIHIRTVRRWVSVGGLIALDDQKPMLILGHALKAFGETQRKPKQKSRLHECYCFSCKTPRAAAFGEGEIVLVTAQSLNVRMLCDTCTTIMHRRHSWSRVGALAAIVHLTAPEAFRDLIETRLPCLNVHFEKDE